MTDKSKILDKIKKCLALSKSSNQHEAQAALRQAQKLMEAHNISEGALLASSVGRSLVKARAKARPAEWEAALTFMVGKCFGCNSYLVDTPYGGYWSFIGVKPANEIAEYTLEVLMRQILKERKLFMDSIHGNNSRAKKTERADLFCIGWIRSVRSAVEYLVRTEEQEAAIKAYMSDNVKVGAEVETTNRSKGKSLSSKDYGAYVAGSEKGKDVRLHHGVDGKQEQLRINHG